MPQKRFTPEQIIGKLRRADVSGGPTELDRNQGAVSGTLLGSCYAALC